jgi:hypothetical protein
MRRGFSRPVHNLGAYARRGSIERTVLETVSQNDKAKWDTGDLRILRMCSNKIHPLNPSPR